MHSLCKKYSSKKRQRVLLIQGGERCCGRTGERTPLVPLQACAGWAKTVNCHAHPRILLPQNRCLPEPLAAPFPRQPEPRCNTLDFAGKVVCHETAGFIGFFLPRRALPSIGFLSPRVRCPLWIPLPTGRSRPYWKPRAKGICHPFGIPARFEMSTHKEKNELWAFISKRQQYKNPQNLIR